MTQTMFVIEGKEEFVWLRDLAELEACDRPPRERRPVDWTDAYDFLGLDPAWRG